MIEITTAPRNRAYFQRLMAFAREVLDVCEAVDVQPIMDGSLAVFGYTQEPTLEVGDVDFGCAESDFARLHAALVERGIHAEIRPWHVLQVRRDGLKVEFGADAYWNAGIPDHHQWMRIGGVTFRVIAFDGLREQYLRGLRNTAPHGTDPDPDKHERIAAKLHLLDRRPTPRSRCTKP